MPAVFYHDDAHARPIHANFTLLLFACFSIEAQADCNSPDSTVEIRECANKNYMQADHKLNLTYHELMKLLDDTGKKLLIDVENAWLKYRDKECSFEGDFYRGGTVVPQIQTECLSRLTKERTKSLKETIHEYKYEKP